MAYVSTLTKSIITHSTLSSVELLEEYIYIYGLLIDYFIKGVFEFT